jgi:hypothetical protein
MYLIHYLPSKAYYSIRHDKKTHVVLCQNFKDALLIKKSFIRHVQNTNKFPIEDKICFDHTLKGDVIRRDYLYNIHVLKNEDIEECFEQFSINNLSVCYVFHLFPYLRQSFLHIDQTKFDKIDFLNERLRL